MSEPTNPDTDEQIRHRAYMIWLEEGQPDGRAADHWDRACADVEAERHAEAANSATPHDAAIPTPASTTATR